MSVSDETVTSIEEIIDLDAGTTDESDTAAPLELDDADEALLSILDHDYAVTRSAESYQQPWEGVDSESDEEYADRDTNEVDDDDGQLNHYQPLEDEEFGEFVYTPRAYASDEDCEEEAETTSVPVPQEPVRIRPAIAPLTRGNEGSLISTCTQLWNSM
jgi:hypothetical protein